MKYFIFLNRNFYSFALYKMKTLTLLLIVIIAAVFLVKFSTTNVKSAPAPPVERVPEQIALVDHREDFVPSNARNVGKGIATIVQLDELSMRASFKAVVDKDASMFDVTKFQPFRPAEPDRTTVNNYIRRVLSRVNEIADRRFMQLDLQSVKRESTFDPSDRGLVDRYMINLFVQEKDSRRVHAAAYNMSMSFVVKPSTNQLQVTELYFITNHFYNEPLVGGDNKYDRDFRLLNPYHLQQPFLTSNDKVLESDDKQIALLHDHNHDLLTPQYRCFEDGIGESNAKNGDQCNANLGHWDKPVVADAECPYFLANKNYVNRLGGVSPDGQFCEMPINTKRVGYRFTSADPMNKPHCYGCRIGADGNPGTIGPCCDEQTNKQLYPNLVTPDFAFPGDALERGQQWMELGDRGIHWQAQPTAIQDINNSHQRQPVFNSIIGGGVGGFSMSSPVN